MQKIFNKRERLIFYVTVGVVGFALVFNFLLVPVLSRFENLNRQIRSLRQKLNKYTVLVSQKEFLESRYAQFSPFSVEGTGVNGPLSSLAQLESMAKNSGIRIIDMRPGGMTAKGRSETLIDLRAQGSVENYFNFIYELENSLTLMRVKGLQLNARPGTSDLEATFSIAQFFPSGQ